MNFLKFIVATLLILLVFSSINIKAGKEDVYSFNEEILKVGLISKYYGDPFLDRIITGLTDEIDDGNIHYVYKSPYSYSDTVEYQKRILKEFINSGLDYIVIIPTHSSAFNDLIIDALSKGINIIIVDTPLEDFDYSKKYLGHLSIVSLNNYQAAYDSANDYFEDFDRELDVLLFTGNLENIHAKDRRDGFIDAIEDHDMNLKRVIDAKWQELAAYQTIMNYGLTELNELDLIICSNDRMAFGVYEALVELGIDDEIVVSGFDGVETAIKYVREKKFVFTVQHKPSSYSKKIIEIILELDEFQENQTTYYVDYKTIMGNFYEIN
jgi:ABC-type sugar transport system substrate-binding protein